MTLYIDCSMCGKEKVIILTSDEVDPGMSLRRIVEDAKWIGQLNGNHFDIYCSKKCAE